MPSAEPRLPAELELDALLDVPRLQALLEDFHRLTGAVVAILDLRGRVHVAVGWQDACTLFHRAHPESARHCRQSDLYLAGHVMPGEHVAYQCANGLWDVVTPLIVGGVHVGNLYTGQFFYDDEQVDVARFAEQADRYGFDRDQYLDAIARVPRLGRERVRVLTDFLLGLTRLVSEQALRISTETALREAEEARRRTEQELHLVLDAIPQAVFWKDREGRYLGCNRVFAREAGVDSPEAIVGKTDFDLPWPREEAEAYRSDDLEVLTTNQPKQHIVEPLQHADGSRVWIDTSKAPLRDEDGRPVGVLGVYDDITERKLAAEALRESEARFALAFRNAPSLMTISDPGTGRFVDVNDAFLRTSGFTRDELIGRTSVEVGWVSAQTRDTMLRPMQVHGRVHDLVVDTRAKDGRTLTCIFNAEVVTLGGQPCLLAAAQDITPLVSSQRALQASEARHRLLADNAQDVIWTMDLQGRFTYVSPSVERLRGDTPAEVMVQGVDEALTPESAALVTRELGHSLAHLARTGEFPGFRGELEQPCKDGSTVWTEVTTSGLRDNEGRVVGIIGVTRDIRDRKRAEVEKAQLEAQLRQAQKLESVGRLAGGVAHDFNNMLGVILGHAEMGLARVPREAEVRDDLEEIRKAASRSAELTRQLLAFARRQTIAPRQTDLNASIEGTLKLLQRLIGEDIRIQWRPEPALWRVRIDPTQLDQVLANLCVNARDAITGQGLITIETFNCRLGDEDCAGRPDFRPGEFVKLIVRDDGAGMASETLSHLFEPFFTTKGLGRGTGLGLATVYGVMQQNGGFLTAESQVGAGSTFSLYFPRYIEPSSRSGQESEDGTTPRRTLLLVEEEPAMRKMSVAVLERLGYRVLAAASPEHALELARSHRGTFEVVLTAVEMTGMGGRDLVAALRREVGPLKAVFMSGYSTDAETHADLGTTDAVFLQTPFTIRQVATRLQALLGDATAQ